MSSRNVAIGLRNQARQGITTSGPAWQAALPAANMLTLDRSEVARTVDLSPANCYVDFDFGSEVTLQAFALQGHNLDQAGQWQVQAGTSPGGAQRWDSALQAAWALTFDGGVQAWESPTWWGIQSAEWLGHPYMAPIIAPAAFNARYLRITLSNPGNAAGYLQVARLWAGALWQPERGAVYGLEHGWTDPSLADRTIGGGLVTDKRRRWRTARLTFPRLTSAESDDAYEIKRRAGTVEEVLYVPQLRDLPRTQRYGFIGRLSALSPVQAATYGAFSTGFDFEEWI